VPERARRAWSSLRRTLRRLGLLVLDSKPVWAYKNTSNPATHPHRRPEQTDARRSRRDGRIHLRGKKGEFGKARICDARGRRRSRKVHDQPHGALHLLVDERSTSRGPRHAHPRRLADRMPFKYNGRIDQVEIHLVAETPHRMFRHRWSVRELSPVISMLDAENVHWSRRRYLDCCCPGCGSQVHLPGDRTARTGHDHRHRADTRKEL